MKSLPAPEVDASTRSRVAASILEHGPSTATELADRLAMTTAGIRRHLDTLCEQGHVESREQRIYGQRGRGRPAKAFALTDAGRAAFYSSYDELATAALRYLRDTVGPSAVTAFAASRAAEVEGRYAEASAQTITAEPTVPPVRLLADVLTTSGYVASIEPAAHGEQLCQHHCPVAEVAAQFPELCQAETEAFSRILGVHVQRLATIAHGDGVCTTHIPTSTVHHPTTHEEAS